MRKHSKDGILFFLLFVVTVATSSNLLAQWGGDESVSKYDDALIHYMQQTADPLPILVVMQPVQPVTGDVWDKPSVAQIEYQIKLKTLELQAELRGFVNEWVGGSDAMIQDYMFLWTTNTFLGKVDQDLIQMISEFPSVQKIMYDRKAFLENPIQDDPYKDVLGEVEFTYGLEKIGIPALRQELPELTGNSVVVGILDTGIDANHPELKGKVIAWKDFIDGKSEPYDGNGHGTHVAGTIAGEGVSGTQIGVAPRAKLVIGKVLSDSGSGSLSGILRGMDWIVNPERKPDSKIRPRVVNNSWGAQGIDADLRKNPFAQQVMTWVQLDVFPAFAAGNAGRGGARTIGTPGNLPAAFAIGATDRNDDRASFSSMGPVAVTHEDGRKETIVKPDISAPGHNVLSSVPGGKYASFSGTSMATPHLVGGVALLYQANPNLSVPQMIELLTATVDDLGEEGKDNQFGFGRLNLIRAFENLSSYE